MNRNDSIVFDESLQCHVLTDAVFRLNRESVASILRGMFKNSPWGTSCLRSPSDDTLKKVQLLLLGFEVVANRMTTDETGTKEGALAIDRVRPGNFDKFRRSVLEDAE